MEMSEWGRMKFCELATLSSRFLYPIYFSLSITFISIFEWGVLCPVLPLSTTNFCFYALLPPTKLDDRP